MILKKLKNREESESPVISEKKLFFDQLFTNERISSGINITIFMAQFNPDPGIYHF